MIMMPQFADTPVLDALLEDLTKAGFVLRVVNLHGVSTENCLRTNAKSWFLKTPGASIRAYENDGSGDMVGVFSFANAWSGDGLGYICDFNGVSYCERAASRAMRMSEEISGVPITYGERDPGSRLCDQLAAELDAKREAGAAVLVVKSTFKDIMRAMRADGARSRRRTPVPADFDLWFERALPFAKSCGMMVPVFRERLQKALDLMPAGPVRSRPSDVDDVNFSDGLMAWPICEAAGMSEQMFRERLTRLDPDQLLLVPKHGFGSGNKPKPGPNAPGVRPALVRLRSGERGADVAAANGISYRVFSRRLQKGWSPERAATEAPKASAGKPADDAE